MSGRVRWMATALASLVVSSLVASQARSGDSSPARGTTNGSAAVKAGPNSLTTKATIVEQAPADIGRSLGLSLQNTGTLGQRIGDARRAFDPVSLALLAQELDAMEKVSGKKASLTSDALAEEAIDLAKARRRPQELSAVAVVLKEKNGAGSLNDLAKQAASEIAEKQQSSDEGESKGIRRLTVVNQTPFFVHVHVHGVHHGEVEPYHQRTFHLAAMYHHQDFIHLEAHTFEYGQELVWKSFDHVSHQPEDFTWTLIP